MKSNLTDIKKLKASFKEGVYTDGLNLIEAWWSYDKAVINFTDSGIEHTSIYPIAWISLCKNKFIYIGSSK